MTISKTKVIAFPSRHVKTLANKEKGPTQLSAIIEGRKVNVIVK